MVQFTIENRVSRDGEVINIMFKKSFFVFL